MFAVLLYHEGIYDVRNIKPVLTEIPNFFGLDSQGRGLKFPGLHLELIRFLFRIRTAPSPIAKMMCESLDVPSSILPQGPLCIPQVGF